MNPLACTDCRADAGLPSGGASGFTNSGQFVIEGTLINPSAVVVTRSALPLDGHPGGIPEYIIPNAIESGAVRADGVSGVNPEF
jgi:hypothetical protein